ncbi:unnamed protein product [Symbiodinium sp. CCMP2592]|nr:unnamed protein product [Symbiodinium sp. CCMP2592]
MKARVVLLLSAVAFLLGREACMPEVRKDSPGQTAPAVQLDPMPLRNVELPSAARSELGLQPGFKHLDLVIAHCHKSLRWIESFLASRQISNVTVFSKCNRSVDGAPANARIVPMQNVGRCDHTYAHWLAEQGHRIPADRQPSDLILFVKDNNNKYRSKVDVAIPLDDMIQTATAGPRFACGRRVEQYDGRQGSMYHLKEAMGHFTLKQYAGHSHKPQSREGQTFRSGYASMVGWMEAMDISSFLENQTVVPVCYGGVFLTTYSQIANPPPGVWERLEQSLSRDDNIEEGHYAERSWAALLSMPLTLQQELDALRRAHLVEDKSWFRGMILGPLIETTTNAPLPDAKSSAAPLAT